MPRNRTAYTYTLTYVNDFTDALEMVVKVDYEKLPWEVDDEFEEVMIAAIRLATIMNVNMDDYSLTSISYGGMKIVSFE